MRVFRVGFDLCCCERSVRRFLVSQMFHLSHAFAGSGSYVRRHVGTVVGLCLASASVAWFGLNMLVVRDLRVAW
jgi:hypothetical protein